MTSQSSKLSSLASLSRKKVIQISFLIFTILFFSSAMLYSLEGFGRNYTGFLRVRKLRFERVPFLKDYPEVRGKLLAKDKGYDGQFFFFMSFDPFLSKYK